MNHLLHGDDVTFIKMRTVPLTAVLVPLQFTAENPTDGLSLNHSGLSQDKSQFPANSQGTLGLQDAGDQQLLNNQNQNYSSGDGRHNVPNIILTGGCGPVLTGPTTGVQSSLN